MTHHPFHRIPVFPGSVTEVDDVVMQRNLKDGEPGFLYGLAEPCTSVVSVVRLSCRQVPHPFSVEVPDAVLAHQRNVQPA